MYTFRSTHANHIVYVDEPRTKQDQLVQFDWNAPAGHIKFTPEGHDEYRRALGVFRTESEDVARRIRALIASGQIPAWEEDEEEAQAQRLIARKREKAARGIAAAATA